MSAEKQDGGSAFPVLYGQTNGQDGMSLRDWFAGQAMASLIIANEGCFSSLGVGAAKDAYTAADAMLKAREA